MFTAPDVVVESTELILAEEADVETSSSPFAGLYEVEREPGTNKVGMVAWRLLLRTPVYPEGRVVMLISNDITNGAPRHSVSSLALSRALSLSLSLARISLLVPPPCVAMIIMLYHGRDDET